MRVVLGQLRTFSHEAMVFAKQLGLTGVQFNTPRIPGEERWELADLVALRRQCEEYGLNLETIENVPISFYDRVLLGLSGRDRQIENYQYTIRNLGRAGIPILGFHFVPTFVWRTSLDSEGRGGAKVTAFDLDEARLHGNKIDYPAANLSDGSEIDADTMWANFEYFMNAVLPVAEESGVKLALHPDDPPVESLGGAARLFTTTEAFKKADRLFPSHAWGLDLCLGCCSEMEGGATNVFEMIEYFGKKKKILYVHFRDVQGCVPRFRECFLGEGNYDPAEVIRRLHAVGFDGYVMDDHVPEMINDEGYGYRSRAYAIGYMQGLIKMLTNFERN